MKGHKQKVNIFHISWSVFLFSVFWTTTSWRGSAWRRLQLMVRCSLVTYQGQLNTIYFRLIFNSEVVYFDKHLGRILLFPCFWMFCKILTQKWKEMIQKRIKKQNNIFLTFTVTSLFGNFFKSWKKQELVLHIFEQVVNLSY